MEKFRNNPLLFINTFLRRDGEQKVQKEEYAKPSKGSPNVYNVQWQSKVRKVFFENQTA